MSFLRDRFLIVVAIITAIVILVMAVFHIRGGREGQPKTTSVVAPVIPFKNEGQLPIKDNMSLSSKGPFRLTRVLDGDTIVLDNGETVRLIGVDAPETHHPELPVQRFGEESAGFLGRF